MSNLNKHGQTIGEQITRTNFNVQGSEVIDYIKQKTAKLINLCEELKAKDPRLASIAITHFETAAMFAVKAETADAREEEADKVPTPVPPADAEVAEPTPKAEAPTLQESLNAGPVTPERSAVPDTPAPTAELTNDVKNAAV